MTCTEFEELSGAYVLDAITPEERIAAEEHLAQCQKCTRLTQEMRSVVDLLPYSVPQVEPSPEVKKRVLSAIGAKPIATSQPLQLPLTHQRRRSPWRNWSMQILAAAAILMFVLFGGMTAWNVSLQQQIASLSANAPATYAIQGTAASNGIHGQLTYYPQQNMTVLVMRGLPQTQGIQIYQGWLLQGKQPTSIGVFNIQNGIATLNFVGNVKGYDATAVSLEPGPKASPDAPKGPVIALGPLQHPVSNT
jgi:anti-sigma-K factor RskA